LNRAPTYCCGKKDKNRLDSLDQLFPEKVAGVSKSFSEFEIQEFCRRIKPVYSNQNEIGSISLNHLKKISEVKKV